MVRIRMKSFGRRHRPFFRICAMDARSPRDGKSIEELGHYDPMVRNLEARAVLNVDRIRYWLSVGAQPSEKVMAVLKRHGVTKPANGEPWALPKTEPAATAPAETPAPARANHEVSKSEAIGLGTVPLMPLRFDVLTLFPGLFEGFLAESILKRAIAKNLVEVHRHDIRNWSEGKHQQVDDRPFGGGPGMVLMAPPVVSAVEAIQGESPGVLIALTPRGRKLDQERVIKLSQESRILLLCGRYEGFDERIFDVLRPEPLSIGDYILSGGEVAAMVVIDAVMRLVPGVLGDAESAVDESFGPDGGLEYPHYTRPREFRGISVPEILLNGDHAAISKWRKEHRS